MTDDEDIVNRSLFLSRTAVEALWSVYQCTRYMYIVKLKQCCS